MKIRRTHATVAMLATGALLLSACTSDDGADDSSGAATSSPSGSADATSTGKEDLGDVVTSDDSISYSLGGTEWTGYNNYTPETYDTYTSVVNDRTQGSFTYFGTDGTVYQDETFGSFELVSEDPMKVEYTLTDEAVWSDGVPVAYEDYLLDWAAQAITDGTDDEGAPVPLFNHVGGIDFGERVPDGPAGEAGDKTFTYTYASPYPDYQLQVTSAFPAHIVAEQSGMTVEDLVAALQAKDVEALRPAAEFWNNGWLATTPGELPDPALTPVSGPYKIESWTAGESITLVANDKYLGTPPATKTLVYRFVAPEAMVQALQNGDLNIIEPQATVDTVAQLEGIGSTVGVETGQTLTWEHLDFNFTNGVFADNLALREAFALCVPRQQIVDNLIKPVDPEAVVMNAREVFPFQDKYEDLVKTSYDGRYDEVDIDAAKAKIAEAGVTGTIDVRIGYAVPNQRRTEQVALIKSSCDEAGFNVLDIGEADYMKPGGARSRGDYEISLFAWAGSGQIVSGQNIYSSAGAQNFGGFTNAEVDAAWETLGSTLDEEKQFEQVQIIEKLLWDELYGIPLFAHPGVNGYDATLENVRRSATQSTVAWNAEQWVRAS